MHFSTHYCAATTNYEYTHGGQQSHTHQHPTLVTASVSASTDTSNPAPACALPLVWVHVGTLQPHSHSRQYPTPADTHAPHCAAPATGMCKLHRSYSHHPDNVLWPGPPIRVLWPVDWENLSPSSTEGSQLWGAREQKPGAQYQSLRVTVYRPGVLSWSLAPWYLPEKKPSQLNPHYTTIKLPEHQKR